MRVSNSGQFPLNTLVGYQVHILSGDVAPDGDNVVNDVNFKDAPVGSLYYYKVNANQVEEYQKLKNDQRNDDWVMVRGRFAQRIDVSEFTDGAGATGTLVLEAVIPAGAFFQRGFLVNVSAAEGESTLTYQLGDGSDVDRYSTGTPSVAAAANIIYPGAPSGTAVHVSAVSTVTVTLTEDDDFTDLTAWAATVVLEYTGAAL